MFRTIAALSLLVALFSSMIIVRAQDEPSSGTIAYVGADDNIYLYDVASAASTPITTDADGLDRAYLWPTWSTDGRLAFFGASGVEDDFYSHALFIRETDGSIGRAYALTGEIFTYAYWSPTNCSSGPNCREIAVLYTATNGGLALRSVTDAGAFSIQELSAGGPHYWDWRVDGNMVWARFGTQLETYDVQSGDLTEIDVALGPQRAIDVSPLDNRVLTMTTTDGRSAELSVIDGDEMITLAAGFRSPVSFTWSPSGEQVAFLDEGNGELYLTTADGSKLPSRVDNDVLGFWWSPNGEQLAYLILTTRAGPSAKGSMQHSDIALQWYVYTVAGDTRNSYNRFFPTEQFIYYLNFFDQFSRSHRVWSPDSRYIVYSELNDFGDETVLLLDTRDPSLPPTIIADGSLGIFSWK